MAVNRGTGNRTMRRVAWLALALLGLVALGDVAYGAAIALTREPAPRPLTGERIFHASRPAVVLVQATYTVKASVPDYDIPQNKQDEITNQLVAMVRSGQLALDRNSVDQAAFDIVASNPDAYFVPSSSRIDDSFDLVNSGSGFFVTEDGYLVTATHVVSAAKADVQAEVLEVEKRPDVMARNRQEFKKGLESGTHLSVSDAQLDRMSDWMQAWEARYVTIDGVDVRYALATGATVQAGDQVNATGVRATLVRQEPIYPDRDVALLKADVGAVPALRLAAGAPRRGQADYVVGYPWKGSLQDATTLDANVPLVLSGGHVQGRLERSGWTAFGTDADVTHGSSGGPVLDGRGDVLGVVSFGTDAGDGTPAQNYFVPSGVVNRLLVEAGVTPKQGTATPTYYRALQEGDAGHYRHELPRLQALADRMPSDPYVKDDIMAAQGAALAGRDRTPPDLLPYWPAAAGASGGALVLAMAAFLGVRIGSRRPVAGLDAGPPAGAEAGAMAGAEAGMDAGGAEAGAQAGMDAGSAEAGMDAGGAEASTMAGAMAGAEAGPPAG